MPKKYWFVDNHIQIDPPRSTKKITGTRFGAVLGKNRWNSEFKAWLEITKTYEEPFEDSIYTLAGKAIEPKQIEYMKKAYFMTNIKTPIDVFGEDYFNKTRGDFFADNTKFGGMWDSLLVDDDNKPIGVLEFKTTKRSEDWKDDIPEYYALQAALYGYLLGVDDVIMVCSFLDDFYYEAPQTFEPSVYNTITKEFKISERYPDFDLMVKRASLWWDTHVDTGISPDFDEKRDADLIKALRTNTLNPQTEIEKVIEEAEEIQHFLDVSVPTFTDQEKRLKVLKSIIKDYSMEQFNDDDNKVEICGERYTFNLTKTISQEIDVEALKRDGIYEKYLIDKVTYRQTIKENK